MTHSVIPGATELAARLSASEVLSAVAVRADINAMAMMRIELSDPAWMDSLRVHLQRRRCPSESTGPDTVEVRVLWSPDTPLTDAQLRAKVFGHLREWCADKPGVQANLLT